MRICCTSNIYNSEPNGRNASQEHIPLQFECWGQTQVAGVFGAAFTTVLDYPGAKGKTREAADPNACWAAVNQSYLK